MMKTGLWLVGVVVGLICALLVYDRVLGANSENRFVIYEIREALEPGMSRAEVQRVVDARASDRLSRFDSDDGHHLTLAIPTGLQSTCDLRLVFDGEELVRALVRDGDTGKRPDDAPPDM